MTIPSHLSDYRGKSRAGQILYRRRDQHDEVSLTQKEGTRIDSSSSKVSYVLPHEVHDDAERVEETGLLHISL
jgi:hypothetical protein